MSRLMVHRLGTVRHTANCIGPYRDRFRTTRRWVRKVKPLFRLERVDEGATSSTRISEPPMTDTPTLEGTEAWAHAEEVGMAFDAFCTLLAEHLLHMAAHDRSALQAQLTDLAALVDPTTQDCLCPLIEPEDRPCICCEATAGLVESRATPFVSPMQSRALNEVRLERKRQDEKWGEQNHDAITWSVILTEEVGEFAQAALHKRFGGSKAAGLRTEAVQVAAVAVAIVECLDRHAALPNAITQRTLTAAEIIAHALAPRQDEGEGGAA